MAIGIATAEKQNGHSGISAVAVFQSKGEGVCRLHHNQQLRPGSQVGKAVSLQGTTARSNRVRGFNVKPEGCGNIPQAKITTAEAMATRKPIIGFLAVDLKEIHGDVPQLPDRVQAQRIRPKA